MGLGHLPWERQLNLTSYRTPFHKFWVFCSLKLVYGASEGGAPWLLFPLPVVWSFSWCFGPSPGGGFLLSVLSLVFSCCFPSVGCSEAVKVQTRMLKKRSWERNHPTHNTEITHNQSENHTHTRQKMHKATEEQQEQHSSNTRKQRNNTENNTKITTS